MAANSRDIRAGAAYVEMYIRDNLTKPLDAMGKKLQQWGANVASAGAKIFAAGAAATGSLLGAVTHFAESGAQLARVAQQIGISVEALSELRYAAQQAGLSFEDLQNLFKGTDNFLQQVRMGSAEAYQALARLGVSVSDLNGKSPDQIFERLAEALSRVQDPTLKAALAMKVFGEAGLRALPMFAQGAAGIQSLRTEARRLGLQVSTQDANAALALSQAWSTAIATVKAAVFAIGSALAPTLKTTLEIVTGYATAVIGWIRDNRELARTVLAITVGVAAVGAGLVTLGIALQVAGIAATGLAAALGVVATILGVLLSPIGLVIAGISAIAVAVLQTTGVLGRLGAAFQEWRDSAMATINAILSALGQGNFALAGDIIYAVLTLAWTKTMNFLSEAWYSFTGTLVSIWDNVTDGIAKTMINAWHGIQAVWYGGILAIGRLVDSTLGTNLATQAEAALNRIRSQWAGELRMIDDMRSGRDADRQRARDQRVASNQQAENELYRRLADLIARANQQAATSNPFMPADSPGIQAASLNAVRMAQPLGTFNPFAARGLAPSDDYQRRIAAATEAALGQLNNITTVLQASMLYD